MTGIGNAQSVSKRRYAVGDKVRVVAENWRGPRIGKVIHIWSDGNGGLPYQVVFRNRDAWNLSADDLEPRA